jgi:hypothetical protein
VCLLASATEDLDLEICGQRLAEYAGHILLRRLSLVYVWTGFAGLADHSDQFITLLLIGAILVLKLHYRASGG